MMSKFLIKNAERCICRLKALGILDVAFLRSCSFETKRIIRAWCFAKNNQRCFKDKPPEPRMNTRYICTHIWTYMFLCNGLYVYLHYHLVPLPVDFCPLAIRGVVFLWHFFKKAGILSSANIQRLQGVNLSQGYWHQPKKGRENNRDHMIS